MPIAIGEWDNKDGIHWVQHIETQDCFVHYYDFRQGKILCGKSQVDFKNYGNPATEVSCQACSDQYKIMTAQNRLLGDS